MQEEHICESQHINLQAVQTACENIPSDIDISSIAEIFKLLSDPTRLKIVLALIETQLCVCDICSVVGLTQSAASHQLRVLRGAHLAKFERIGKMIYYSIDDEHVASIIKMAQTHINHTH